MQIKKDTQSLKFLLQKKGVAFEEVDMAQLDKAPRDKVRQCTSMLEAATLALHCSFYGFF